MSDQIFPESGLPIRRTVDLLPQVFKTESNSKFLAGVLDPLTQPGTLQKTVGYIGRRFGKTYKGADIYLDSDATLRSRYQLEPGVLLTNEDNTRIEKFYDYIDFKNQIKFFNNFSERDDNITSQEHYTWNPPIEWDKFINFREYYWVPAGPPDVKVLGQLGDVISTYTVKQGVGLSWIFSPDGQTNNPTLTLYRGQTYKFRITSPGEGFSIRSAYDTGSLNYNPIVPYVPKQLAVFDGKLWRARNFIPGRVDNTIEEGADWELVDNVVLASRLDYNFGVENNGIDNGEITFEVPLDAPDVLFYQSTVNADRFGRFIIADIESNSRLDVEKEILGKQTYTSSNRVEFTNGLLVSFAGRITPAKYAKGQWLVENVGREIKLIKFDDLTVPIITNQIPDVIFDNEGFDTLPFDDATTFPAEKDYITICRSSIDGNPWSRYNRWFHRSVLEYAHRINGTDFDAADTARAKRPIIEFRSNLQLFNHGSTVKQAIDFIDDYTDDVFSKIEGSQGYSVDGEFLFNGARILITADTDSLANNRIYRVEFITHNNRRQIALRKTDDSEPILGEGLLVKRGTKNKGLMYHFNGTSWAKSQEKISVNQSPLFDLFDENGVSFSDPETYPVSSFVGSKIVGYKQGNTIVDSELGLSLDYLNIDNVGDILFEFELDSGNFEYTTDQDIIIKNYNTGYYRFNPTDVFDNGWLKFDHNFAQPILDSKVIEDDTNIVEFKTVNWDLVDFDNPNTKINFYIDGEIYKGTWTRNKNTFTFDTEFEKNKTLSVEIYATVEPNEGYYFIPLGLEKNPLNENLRTFTLGQAIDHIATSLEIYDDFNGSYPGVSNLRDINGYQSRTSRFLKHSGISPTAISLLCDKDINIIKSIQYCSRSYTNFKHEFIKLSNQVDFNDNIPDLLDSIISVVGTTKNSSHPFADSDMIGSGAFSRIVYEVEDTEITVFALSEKFDLTESSRKAVYVYVNNQQLIFNQDYEFDFTFGFVRINKTLNEGDIIEIREYVSTGFNYIPPTPTKLGLFKKYLPRKFLDDRFQEPRYVIEGHDGSITTAYNDFRDDLLLELELRIYNNIKQQYDESIFDIDSVIGGYYGNSLYNKSDLDAIISIDFLRWVSNTDLDFTDNLKFFDDQNSFTFTYSQMTDPSGAINLPGYWRGVYQWFYDTDRPHTCPWEMLGFSEKPTWWEREYGPAPYTSNNLILWEDIRDGIIRQGPRAGTHKRYARNTIISHIPVDGDGRLLSPLDSNLANDFSLINNKNVFKLGDISPVEYAWRSSSEYPYAIITALCLMKPFEFITDSFDRSIKQVNILNQTICKETGTFIKLENLKIPEVGGNQTVGLVNFISSYVRSKNLDPVELLNSLNRLDIRLSNRLSGFVDQTEQKYLLDSKSPRSETSSVFVPPENYDIIFNVSAPILSISYSGVIVEKTDRGWKVKGYDSYTPYFNYFSPVRSTTDPLITVGGTSEKFVDWTPDKIYENGILVRYNDRYYRCLRSHTSGAFFDSSLWKLLPSLPLTGAQQAYFRTTFDTLSVKKLLYGTVLNNIQEVVDFLLGYEAHLKSLGFSFDRYDPENQVAFNWATSCKEFMFWTKHNWEIGSLITLSPSAEELTIDIPLGVADNLFDPFYDYQIFKSDGTPLLPTFLNVKRDFQNVVISTVNTNDGIFFIKINFVLKEHVVVFDDRTVFNDVLYDKTTGYRQERIKSRGFRTVDWDGDYTSPGFLFDNVNIQSWQPFLDYRLGDIVSYKSYFYTSLENQNGTDVFDDTKWSRLDLIPSKGLIPNFDYRINQFEDYYDLDADGLGTSQRDLSRHVLGYQTREYLQNLAEDQVSQFKLYQGFIREKGTSNAITKIFDKLGRATDESVVLNEEWAFKVGRFGGIDQYKENEFRIFKNNLKLNPQPVLIAPVEDSEDILDLYLRVPQKDFTVAEIPFTNSINPTRKYDLTPRTAGYVKSSQIKFVCKTKDDILNLDINDFEENDHVWITFDNTSWTVLRYNLSRLVFVVDVNVNKTIVELFTNRAHNLEIGDIFGVRGIENLEGFYKVIDKSPRSITIQIARDAKEPKFESSTLINLELFTVARYPNYQESDLKSIATLTDGARLWIDKNQDDLWEVIEKKSQFLPTEISDYGSTTPLGNGTAVVQVLSLGQSISSMPSSNAVAVYVERTDGLYPAQVLIPPLNISSAVNGVWGETLSVSPDGRWLAVGSPNASGVKSRYKKNFDPEAIYEEGDIVLKGGLLWRAIQDDPNGVSLGNDGSTIDLRTEGWEPIKIITADDQGSSTGFEKQGSVTIYEWLGQSWGERYTFISPRQDHNEQYGSKISIGKSGNDYFMAVSAPGSQDEKGRVYLYKYSSLTEIIKETITFNVIVGSRVGPGSNAYSYFIDGEEDPKIKLLVGNTYVFDQSHPSNAYFPNTIGGPIFNAHPMYFSEDLSNTIAYQEGVSYFIDNEQVSRETYNSRFNTATSRKIQIEVTEKTNLNVYYRSTNTATGSKVMIRRYPNIAREWQQLEDHRYRGFYDTTGNTLYYQGDIVYYNDNLWFCLEDSTLGDVSTIDLDSVAWRRIDPISTQTSLPTNIAVEYDSYSDEDSSTLPIGLLSNMQIAELVKQGDRFGSSLAMSQDGSILVVGAPDSDGQYFSNYKGVWKSYQEYREGDTVKYQGTYYRLTPDNVDSAYTSTGDVPTTLPWVNVGYTNNTTIVSAGNFVPGRRYVIETLGDTDWESIGYVRPPATSVIKDGSSVSATYEDPLTDPTAPNVGKSFIATGAGSGTGKAVFFNGPSGKIYIYKRNQLGLYNLTQTIEAGSLANIDDTGTKILIADVEISSTTGTEFSISDGQDISLVSPGMTVRFSGSCFGGVFENEIYYITSVSSTGTEFSVSTIKNGRPLELIDSVGLINPITGLLSISKKMRATITEEQPSAILEGDQFGFSLDIDNSGSAIVVSSPQADLNLQNQGSVYVLKTNSTEEPFFRLKQKLESFETYNNELFGFSVSISERTERIAVGAKNSPFKQVAIFDSSSTTFDRKRTTFSTDKGFPGQVYVFELKDSTYILAEKLQARLEKNESFGYSLDCSSSNILVGSPDYKIQLSNGSETKVGITRLFKKDSSKNSLDVIAREENLVNLDLLKSISLFDDKNVRKLADVDIIDSNKLKIIGLAEQEIKFKTLYDPATYTNGNDTVVVDEAQAWFERHVGEIWWNLTNAKWIYYEQGDIAYRSGNWNQLAEGASIDVYEWVESPYLPNDWDSIADTVEGLTQNISGKSLYGNSMYSIKRFRNPSTGEEVGTKYYFWVKGKTIVPGFKGRKISSAEITRLISDPASSGLPLVSIIDKDKYLFHNFSSIISGDSALFNIEYYNNTKNINSVHSEYQLLTEGVADSVPSAALEEKWLDSLIGVNKAGIPVPDLNLTAKQRYGLSFRPSQTMFIDRIMALEITIERANSILKTRPFVDLINFGNLNKIDEIPDSRLNFYDQTVETLIDLAEVGTVRVKRAQLEPILLDGRIQSIRIIDPGFGYKVPPTVEVIGDGFGAKIELEIDNQGRIKDNIKIQSAGRKYTEVRIEVRYFSVLVLSDSSVDNFWTIYSWDDEKKEFFKSKVQSYDTTKFWSYIDWYDEGVNVATRIVSEIQNLYILPTLTLEIDDIIRIKEFASGGWALLKKVAPGQGNILNEYNLVGRQNGTIELSSDLYDLKVYDDESLSYDSKVYDDQPTEELRFIFAALKEDIFIDDLRVEWNKLFFSSIRYVFSEQIYVDWAFKTSFLNAIHNVGDLIKKVSYKNDNLDSYRKYIEEVKPFRTTIREYTSRYDRLENYNSSLIDFDNPPVYSPTEGRIVPVDVYSSFVEQFPWKYWFDNRGYSIVHIEVSYGGDGYITAPNVVISGDGSGATAQAFISNGKVVGIKMLTVGENYSFAPTVSLVGGNANSQDTARAVAILGDSKTRSFDLTVKFDRITKNGSFTTFTKEDEFTADGFSAIFDLTYPPTRDRSKVKVYKNQELLLNSQYEITFYKTNLDSYTKLKARLKLLELPALGDMILVEYEKNIEIFDSVDRISRSYAPTSGMLGKEINQLMTGIDFGGVQIQGTTFDVSGGWDALPWFTDNWDSVESNSDFYYIINLDKYDDSTVANSPDGYFRKGSIIKHLGILYRATKPTINDVGDVVLPSDIDGLDYWEKLVIELPYVPADGQLISIYLKRAGIPQTRDIDNLEFSFSDAEPKTVRIDDPNWGIADSTMIVNKNAVMKSFIGDGLIKTIDIQEYVNLNDNDTLIFRPTESDGTVVINDVNILDTKISGGSLSHIDQIYQTASGVLAEEIVVEGGKFISPDYVPAPEENIPGQVLESVSIKCYHTVQSGAAPLQTKIYNADGITRKYNIGLTVVESNSVLVYVDKIKYDLNSSDSTTEYIINFNTNEIEFRYPPERNKIVEIISIGVGGIALLDYQEFEADGDTLLFLTRADYSLTQSVVVTVDGQEMDIAYANSSDFLETKNKTLIQFGERPLNRQIVKIVCLGSALDTDSGGQSLVRINQQILTYDGSSRSFDLDRFVNLTRASSTASIVVNKDGEQLNGVDTILEVYNGTNNIFVIGQDPRLTFGEATNRNIKVFFNNQLRALIIDYTYDGTTNIITLVRDKLSIGDEIKIEVDVNSDYYIENNNIVINPSVPLVDGDQIEVTWFSEYPSMDMTSDQYVGGKSKYQLSRVPLAASFVWVYVNGIRLTQDQDYEIDLVRKSVILKNNTSTVDEVKIVQFGSDIRRPPMAFEVYKDMLNVYHYKRFSRNKNVILDRELNYYDQQITVSDATDLFEPISGTRKVPGILFINGERIEYFSKNGNVLSQLRRGSYGTAIAAIHENGSEIVDVSVAENLPYNESQEREDFVSDGSTTIIGPLSFVPKKSSRDNWYKDDIPEEYGPCDEIEVFVGGRRLRKDPITVYSEDLGSSSPEADIQVQAEFSVNGTDNYIRLSSLDVISADQDKRAGVRITIIRKTGQIWYDRSLDNVSKGLTLVDNESPILKFITQKSTELPE